MEILDQLPKLVDLINKAGVIGLLLIVCAVLTWEVRRLRKELTQMYGLRDRYRAGYLICKSALDYNKIYVDLSQMQELSEGENG
jgi:hypothetical protein